MNAKQKSLCVLLLTVVCLGYAQNNNFNNKFVTLSNGKYQEFHDQSNIVEIGSVFYNTSTGKIVGLSNSKSSSIGIQPHFISRWMSPDPLSEEYSSWSPYNYVMNNPIIFIDPDGQKVVFAQGVSAQFKQEFSQAVQHLNKNGASGMLASLEKSDQTYTISETSGGSSYTRSTRTIAWDSNKGLLTNEGHELSATSILNHEVDHALQHDQNPDQQKADRKIPDANYGNKEEKRVIEGSEQTTAKKLGEIKEGEVTRKDHFGTLYDTAGPTTTENVNIFTITAPKPTSQPTQPKKDENQK